MIDIVCSFCLCLAMAMQHGSGNCHKCVTDVSQDEAMRAVKALKEPEEFAAVNCRPRNTEAKIDFNRQGAIVSKGKK